MPPAPYGMMPGAPQEQGSLGLGIAIGFFTGCIGAIITQFVAKGAQTKKGAWIGFGIQFVVGIIFNVIAAASH
jgi:hypothetical protein